MILVFGPNESINRSRAIQLSGNEQPALLTDNLVKWAKDTDKVFYSCFSAITIENFSWLLEHGITVDWQHDHNADPWQYFWINLINKFYPGSIDLDPYNLQQTTVDTSSDEILFYGCSHTQGGHWISIENNYPHQVCVQMEKIPRVLSKIPHGSYISGNYHNFNLFTNTNFCAKQIVVFQITDLTRIRLYDENAKIFRTDKLENLPRDQVLNLTDYQLFSTIFEHLQLMIKYARSKQLQFVFFNLSGQSGYDRQNNPLYNLIEYYFSKFPEFIPGMLELTTDRAEDNTHFGIESNRRFANQIVQKIKLLYKS